MRKYKIVAAVLLTLLPCRPSAGQDFIAAKYRPLAQLISSGGRQLPTGGNDIEIIIDGGRKYYLLTSDLSRAGASINIEYYRFSGDEDCTAIRDILCDRASEGVRVRFSNENLINTSVPRSFYTPMQDAGIEIENYARHKLLPSSFLYRTLIQNHRKVVTTDGFAAYIGGMNIDKKYFHTWRDTHLRIEGPAVAKLQEVFMETWRSRDKSLAAAAEPLQDPALESSPYALSDKVVQIVSDKPTWGKGPIERSYIWALDNVGDYIYIQSPYFAPTRSLRRSFKGAARRGADVRLMVPKESDMAIMRDINRSYYRGLLKAGVRIFEKDGAFIHSKTFVTDDYLSCIGSANWDWRSMRLNYEDNAYIYDSQTAGLCKQIWGEDMQQCSEVSMDTIRSWSLPRKIYHSLLHIIAPLF